jgi:hypothetical protein
VDRRPADHRLIHDNTAAPLQLVIAWFNRPKFLVPPYLRHEPGVWQQRKAARKAQ